MTCLTYKSKGYRRFCQFALKCAAEHCCFQEEKKHSWGILIRKNLVLTKSGLHPSRSKFNLLLKTFPRALNFQEREVEIQFRITPWTFKAVPKPSVRQFGYVPRLERVREIAVPPTRVHGYLLGEIDSRDAWPKCREGYTRIAVLPSWPTCRQVRKVRPRFVIELGAGARLSRFSWSSCSLAFINYPNYNAQ